MASEASSGGAKAKKAEPWWLLYVAALLGGLLFLSEAIHYYPLMKISAKLGIALIYSAFALLLAGQKRPAIAAAVLIWLAVIGTFLV
jgi:RsiW-degrading membrane proteinase PrsW (M82 family)